MKPNSAALAVFTNVVKETGHTELWDGELAWYYPNATYQICRYSV